MELYIQMGHNTGKLALEHLEDLGVGWFFIRPFKFLQNKIVIFSYKDKKKHGRVFLDPQLYYPRKFHKKLSEYAYWPNEDITALEAGQFDQVVSGLADLNKEIDSDVFILPSTTAKRIDSLWNKVQKLIIESAQKYAPDMEYMHTIAISSEVANDENQIEQITSFVEEWDIPGVYIVCEHPKKFYLVDRPLWVSNIMSLAAGIKRQHKKVVIGYASHQLLCMALTKCDAVASGNYLNVRWFKPEHFETTEEKKPGRRALWYYCPQALSEYKIPFLDIANRMKLLNRMEPPATMRNPYSDMLFSGGLPSSTGFGEKETFRHYLYCLRKQCQNSVRGTYEETKDAYLALLGTAEQLLSGLADKGIRGQDRDFTEICDVNRAAVSAFDMAYQFSLSREWGEL